MRVRQSAASFDLIAITQLCDEIRLLIPNWGIAPMQHSKSIAKMETNYTVVPIYIQQSQVKQQSDNLQQ